MVPNLLFWYQPLHDQTFPPRRTDLDQDANEGSPPSTGRDGSARRPGAGAAPAEAARRTGVDLPDGGLSQGLRRRARPPAALLAAQLLRTGRQQGGAVPPGIRPLPRARARAGGKGG